MVFILLIMVLATAIPVYAASTLREYYNTGGDANSANIYGGNFVAQQFTSDATSHTVDYIKLELLKVGTPSILEVSLYDVDSVTHKPTTVITSVSYAGTVLSTSYAMHEFDITDTSLLPSTEYAIVVSCLNGDNANYVQWHQDSGGGLANAIGSDSTDSGVTWTIDAGGADYLFEIWGEEVFEVVGANVFEDYIEDGDWLITIETINAYPEYYNTSDPSRYFNVQLLDVAGANVLASTTLKNWGDSVCAIYLSPTVVTSLTSGSAYIIQMIGTFTGNPYVQYTLQNTVDDNDWAGSDPRYLDQWCITVAKHMNAYDGNTSTNPYTTKTSDGEILTTYGGSDFIVAIPEIMEIRPDLFETASHTPNYDVVDPTNAYDDATTWQAQVGATIADDADAMADVLGVTAKQFLSMGIWAVYAFCMLFIFASRGGAETIFTMVLCIPVLLVGLNFRIIEMQVFTVASALAVLLFVLKMFFTK